MRNDILKNAKRIVFKFGTNVLRGKDGNLSFSIIASFIEQIVDLHKKGIEIIIVTSGAVGLGAKKISADTKRADTVLKQACAAIGQGYLMSIYENIFSRFDICTAQVLLTEDDFANRSKYLNLSNVLNKLLSLRVIPIINQNDTVSSSELEYISDYVEISFSDNDKLSALISSKLNADLLVILSDVDGLYDDNPKVNKNAKIIKEVKEVTNEIESLGQEASLGGRGGMRTKLQAAKVVTRSGGSVIIANGKVPFIIDKIFKKEDVGTIFLPKENLSGKKRWIGYAVNISGQIIINECAKEAILNNDASLLPIGVVKIRNDFQKGDVVSILDESGNELAHGIINYNCSDCKKIIGLHSDEIMKVLGYKNYDAIITRDNIVIL